MTVICRGSYPFASHARSSAPPIFPAPASARGRFSWSNRVDSMSRPALSFEPNRGERFTASLPRPDHELERLVVALASAHHAAEGGLALLDVQLRAAGKQKSMPE